MRSESGRPSRGGPGSGWGARTRGNGHLPKDLLTDEKLTRYSSGDTHCYMTYKLNFIETSQSPPFALWDAEGKRHTGLFYRCAPTDCVQTRFCDDPADWRIGPAAPPNSHRGSCLRQFWVNHHKHRSGQP